jgi:O-antigen/teichoic acid export membrane protein
LLKDLKYTAKHIVIYSIGNLSTKLIGFVLLPLYTGYLTTDEYGMLALLEVTSFMLIAFVGMRLSTAMMRWGSSEEDEDTLKSIVFTTFITLVILSILFNVIFQPLAGSFSRILFEDVAFKNYFRVLFLFVSFEILNVWTLDLIRIKSKPLFYVILSLVKFIVVIILNIYFIKYQGLGVLGIILSQLIGSVILFVLSFLFVVQNIKPEYNLKAVMPMFRYGFPLVFTTISMYLLSLGDRYLMKYMLDMGEVGIYSLGYKIATVTNLLIIQSFQTGFLPIAYKMYEKPGKERFFIKSLTYYTFVLVVFSLALSLFSKELITLLSRDEAYIISYTIVPFVSLALVFKGIQYVFSLSLHFVKNTKFNAFIVLFVAVFNLLLNYLLLPRFGIYGAGMASIVSFFLMLVFFRIYSKRYYDPGYEIGKLFMMIFTGIGLYMISYLFRDLPTIPVIILKFMLVMVFPLILFLLGFYEKIELERIRGFIRKWNKPSYWFSNLKEFFTNE